ncbi:condensation domain-containing protein, partial [Kitasatospora sp. NPDC004799]|uniref:condensation domain-containing protein n=1 Tax=Kitasatospora sp. NPDC004799 TaxID=3154460 RepID=UPI0033A1722D
MAGPEAVAAADPATPPEPPAGLPDGVVDAFPATRLQRGMFLHAVRDGAHLYHDVLSYTVDRRLEEGPLAGALREAVAAHPALRSAFAVDRPDGPVQLVHSDARIDCAFVDLTDLPEDARRARLDSWAAEQRRVPFDWSVPGLLRVFVHRTGEQQSVLSLSVHHTVLDGWSAATLVTELLLAHDRLARGLPTVARPADTAMRRYAELERTTERDSGHRSFWRDYLDGVRPTPLPDASPDGSATLPLVEVRTPLPAGAAERFAALARTCGVPMKSAYLAVHLAALSFMAGETEVTTGLVTSGRLEEAGGDTALGLFLNTVPLRAEVADLNWPELLASVFDNEAGLYAHRRFPLERIQAETGTARLCPTAFNYTDFHVYDGLVRAGIALSDVRYHEETDFPLLVAVHEDPFGGPATLVVGHHTDRPEDGLAARYAEFFAQLLRHAATDPHQPAVRALGQWARERGATAGLAPGAAPTAPGSLLPVLAERLGGDQDAPLLTDGRTEWTRGRIAARVGELRTRLAGRGVGPGDRVADDDPSTVITASEEHEIRRWHPAVATGIPAP